MPPAAPLPAATERTPSPEVPRPLRRAGGWVEAGLGVVALPITLTVMALVAPILWMMTPGAASKP